MSRISFSSLVMMWTEFECETSLIAKTPETCQHFSGFLFSCFFLWFAGAYQIFERMTSFFSLFFDRSFGHIVFGEADPPFAEHAKVERVVLNALAKQMRLCRLNLISSNGSRAMRRRSCAFGGWFWHRLRPPPPRLRRARREADPPQRSRTNGSITHR